MSIALFFLAVSPCVLVPFAVSPRFAPTLTQPRLRGLCAEFLGIAGASLSLAFAFFWGDLPWWLTALALIVAVLSAACCLMVAGTLAIRATFSSQSTEATTWEGEGQGDYGGTNLSTVDPL